MPVENLEVDRLLEGVEAMALEVDRAALERCCDFAAELLKWNTRVNLTAITAPAEVIEKHLLDSLAVLPEVAPARSLLDIGAGAGLPGVPLALALPALSVQLVDAVSKKTSFCKTAIAKVGLVGRVRATHARAAGSPGTEGIALADTLIARALTDVSAWLQMARPYVLDDGRVIAMLGQMPATEVLERIAEEHHYALTSHRTYSLPFSKVSRGVAVFHVKHSR
jgi:16S rRNA (guanine527-N7)-methyltransferase